MSSLSGGRRLAFRRASSDPTVPGGIGTVLETFMIWQLLQVRQVQNTPLILIGKMWSELLEWAKIYMLKPELHHVNPEDLSIPHCANTADEAITLM